jgi:hypothetical protein
MFKQPLQWVLTGNTISGWENGAQLPAYHRVDKKKWLLQCIFGITPIQRKITPIVRAQDKFSHIQFVDEFYANQRQGAPKSTCQLSHIPPSSSQGRLQLDNQTVVSLPKQETLQRLHRHVTFCPNSVFLLVLSEWQTLESNPNSATQHLSILNELQFPYLQKQESNGLQLFEWL